MSFVIETERLKLREFKESDARFLFELNDDPEIIKYTGDTPFTSVQDAQKFLLEYEDYTYHGYGRWVVVRKSDDDLLGWCGLKYNELNMVDIGFRLFRKYWGKGYATEAARASLKYGFEILKLEEIIARSHPENERSIKVIKTLNFKSFKIDDQNHMDWVYFRIKMGDYLGKTN